MSQQEEQPRPSLRLRKASDRPPDAPPQAPPAEPPAAAPAQPAETPPEAGGRLRLSSIIKPGSSGSTPPAPPEPPPAPPEPPAAQASPPAPPPAIKLAPAPVPEPEAIPEATPAPASEKVAPPPVAAATPPPPPAAPVAPAPAPAMPKRPADFPPPPALKPEDAKETPKPPSPRAIGLVLAGVVILVLGGIGYLLFLDPLGLFKDAEPPQAAAPAATAPASTAPAATTPAATPAQPAPTPDATIAPAGPGLIEEMPEFTMPPPAPLAGGEEIAPGVVRLPRDADPVSTAPAQRAYEPPAPKPNPAYTALVNNLNISGIRPNSSGGFLMIGTMLHRPGDIVDQQSQLEFVGLDGQVITFKDPAGAIYTRRF